MNAGLFLPLKAGLLISEADDQVRCGRRLGFGQQAAAIDSVSTFLRGDSSTKVLPLRQGFRALVVSLEKPLAESHFDWFTPS